MGVLFEIESRVAQGKPITEAIDREVVAAFMARYKEAAGTARDTLNAAPATIAKSG